MMPSIYDIKLDAEDFWVFGRGKCNIWKHNSGRLYATIRVDGKTTLLHRFLMGAPKGLDVDHIDGDALNNQRANLRLCSRAENLRNKRIQRRSSNKYKGVKLMKGPYRTKRWRARVGHTYVGLFATEEDAARAYDKVALIQFGAFARLNFPQEHGLTTPPAGDQLTGT